MTRCESLETVRQWGLKPPKTLTIAITAACNLACQHCWVEAGLLPVSAHVPTRSLMRIIKEFAALGGEGLRITGGEPLCHPHVLNILQSSRALGFKAIILQTNAMLLKDEHLTALHELEFPGLSIQVSLDGATADTHDLVRGKGAFDGALSGLVKLVQYGLAGRITLFLTEMRHNLEDIPALLEFAERMGISSFSSGALVPCGRATGDTAAVPPDSAQYLKLLERYDTDPRFRELYRKIGRIAALEWRTGETVRHEHCTFVENPYLTPSGVLYPCLLCHTGDFSVSGVFEKGFAAVLAEGAPIWSSLLQISRSRTDTINECRDCPLKPCCGGGCMGRAWGSRGDLVAADDRCEVRQAIYRYGCNCRY